MNKTELIEAVATRSQTTKTQTTAMLNELLEVIQETIASGNDVQLVGFGGFRTSSNGFNQFSLVHGASYWWFKKWL